MAVKVKVGGSWVDPKAIYAKVSGAWVALSTPIDNPPISFVKSIVGSSLNAGVVSVTFTGHQVGDLLLVMAGNQTSSPSAVTSGSGWTLLGYAAAGNQVRCVAVYAKWATSTADETVTLTGGTGTSASTYSGGMVFRGVRGVGARDKSQVGGAAATTINFKGFSPGPNVTDGTSCMVVMMYLAGASGFSTTPTGWSRSDGMLYRLAQSSLASGTANTSASSFNVSISLELVA